MLNAFIAATISQAGFGSPNDGDDGHGILLAALVIGILLFVSLTLVGVKS